MSIDRRDFLKTSLSLAGAATLLKLEPREVDHIRCAGELGLGEMDVKRMEIRMV